MTIWRQYLTLCKPMVVMLMLISALVGMMMAKQQQPIATPALFWGLLGIGLTAASGASVNHWVDRHLDARMARTKRRPLPQGWLSPREVLLFSLCLAGAGVGVLYWKTNVLTALLTLAAMLGYAMVYTAFLKHQTPQNIVIGGLSGAMPPLLGWSAVTGHVQAEPLWLVALIFVWTPAHFWSLALYRYEDYRQAEIPMLPVTHGLAYTRLQVMLYACLTTLLSMLCLLLGWMGWVYGLGALVLNGVWLKRAWALYRSEDRALGLRFFHSSNIYLLGLFILMLVDPWLSPLLSP